DSDLILSTVPPGGVLVGDPSGYARAQGTSMACPYVAGLAGLVLSKNPQLTPLQVRRIVEQGADAFGLVLTDPGAYIGPGRVDLQGSLNLNTASTASATISAPAANFMTGPILNVTG